MSDKKKRKAEPGTPVEEKYEEIRQLAARYAMEPAKYPRPPKPPQ